MKNIVFLPSQESSFHEFLYYANRIKKTTKHSCQFFLPKISLIKYEHILQNHDINYYVPKNYRNNLVSYFEKIIGFIFQKISIIRKLDHMKNSIIFMLRKLEVKSFLKKNEANIVVLADDRVIANFYNTSFLVICKEYKIPTLIPPWANFSGKNRMLQHRRNNKNLFLATDCEIPENLIQGEKNKYRIYDMDIYKVLKSHKIFPKNPLAVGGGLASNVFTASKNEKSRLVKAGINKNKVYISGNPRHDVLFNFQNDKEKLKDEILLNHTHLEKNKKNILFNVPALFEDQFSSLDNALKYYNDIFDVIKNLKQNVILSFHPKMKMNLYGNLLKRYNLKIIDYKIEKLIPISDIYIGLYSTIDQWSILCKVPVIIPDFLNLNYKMYDHFKSIKKVFNKFDLKNEMENFLNKNCRSDRLQILEEDSKKLYPFDGRSEERFIKGLLSISKK